MRLQLTKDVRKVAAMHKELMPGDPVLAYGKDVVNWILYDKGKAVGFCSVKRCSSRGELFLSRAAIATQYRGLGLHRRMIKARIKWAKENGFRHIVTYTSLENPRSSNNLVRCGFSLFHPADYWAGKEMLYFYFQL